jgi:hypothetical protein
MSKEVLPDEEVAASQGGHLRRLSGRERELVPYEV